MPEESPKELDIPNSEGIVTHMPTFVLPLTLVLFVVLIFSALYQVMKDINK